VRKLTIIITLIIGLTKSVTGQVCTANYLYSGTTETITFTNTSSVSNAHYYWHFGDGEGSNQKDPVHIFPDDGTYLVTLFCHDTVAGCSNYIEKHIVVNKPDTISCNAYYKDTVVGDTYSITDLTTGCNPYYSTTGDVGPCGNYMGCWFGGFENSLFVSKMRVQHIDTIACHMYKEYFRTVKYQYTSATNYQNCSANFEVIMNYQTNGVLVTFSAMNRNATSYQWAIIGFGNPIYVTTPTMSYLYSYPYCFKTYSWLVTLSTHDTNNNCGDTLTQSILIRNPLWAIDEGIKELSEEQFSIYPNPVSTSLNIIFASPSSSRQLTVFNSLGQKIHSSTLNPMTSSVDFSSFDNGLYFIEISSDKSVSRRKIIKQ
jgi:hypothetical protein